MTHDTARLLLVDALAATTAEGRIANMDAMECFPVVVYAPNSGASIWAVLTRYYPSASYDLPVCVVDDAGHVYGPADITDATVHHSVNVPASAVAILRDAMAAGYRISSNGN